VHSLDQAKLNYTELVNVAKQTAKLIADGNIVGWFQGRMEFGPRALGARSILADPTRADMKDIVNKWVNIEKIFALCSVSSKRKSFEYLKMSQRVRICFSSIKLGKKSKEVVPAITHTDGTARPQTVDKATNGLYYDLICEFEKIRHVPMLLNTSFNIMGEPIVESPETSD